MGDNFKYSNGTGRIIGAAIKVHSALGAGNFTELIFQRALLLELAATGLSYVSEKEFPIYYRNKLIGKKRLDLLIEGKILVELKAVTQFENIHFNQVINYLKIFNVEVGLLINFGAPSLQIKRFVNSKL